MRAYRARRGASALYSAPESWGVIGEWDYGHNAFSSGNLLLGQRTFRRNRYPHHRAQQAFAAWNTMVGKILNTQAVQMGWDFLGHVDIPHTPFTAFGEFQQFLPNTRITKDPLDFQRYDLGVQWLVNKYLRVAFDSQAIMYYHSQFTFPEIGGERADDCGDTVRGAARHARIHAEHGVQILATNRKGRREHAKCSRRPLRWTTPPPQPFFVAA